ncbi:MAG: hypothetical protein ACNA8J_03155 [Gammaproteobacteria bacterium]
MKQDKSKVGLREGIRELVRADELDVAELAKLHRLSQSAPSNPARRRWLGAAAGFGVAAMTGYFGSTLVARSGNAQRLADEIAVNHLRIAPLDIASGDLDRARDAFASLGFHLLDAAEVENLAGTLMGGRFCSVASVPAAMLRYRTETGVATVYQARHDPHRHRGVANLDAGEPGVMRYAGGVEVCLCRTQGVLIAIAKGGSKYAA